MGTMRWLNISLASKCRLLFGVAVLVILAAALYVPWDRMNSLADEHYVGRAREIAMVARVTCDLQGGNWARAQQQLNQRWSTVAKMAGLGRGQPPPPVPQLIAADAARMFGRRGFKHASVKTLRANPAKEFTYRIKEDDESGHEIVRLAMAVRAGETDPNPGELQGIIYVEIPTAADSKLAELGFFNVVVLVGSGLGAGLLAILVFYLITQRLILSPVRKLRRVAQQVTNGDLDVRSAIATGDEFEQLGEAFNDMLVHLQASQEELRTLNRSLDIRLGELAETNVALFEANKLKSEFLANVSHELRTPLVSIIGFAELLRDMMETPPKDQTRPERYTKNILDSGRMLLDMINDLLDLAKIDAGKIELHRSHFSIADICTAMMDFVRPQAEKKNLRISHTVENDIEQMHSDAGKTQQILHNLLSNAIKFTPSGGQISLQARSDGEDQVELTVEDTGPGIPEDQQSAIFEKFRQLDSSATREYGGSGLGLAITRDLAHLLGGTIRVESVVGQGSRFIVTLPLESPADAERKLIGLT